MWWGQSVGLRPTRVFDKNFCTFARHPSSLSHCGPPGGDMELVCGRSAGLWGCEPWVRLGSYQQTRLMDTYFCPTRGEGCFLVWIPTNADISSWSIRLTRWRPLERFKPDKTSVSWRTAGSVSSAKGAQRRANLILLPDMTLLNISKNVYIFLILYSSGI